MEEEAIFDEEYGWTRYTPGEPLADTTFVSENQMRGRRRSKKPLSEGLATDDDSKRPD